jgi:3-oxoacyl-[acyl-carrier-protein] synthase II
MAEKIQYFINGIGIISPQRTFDADVFLSEIMQYDANVLTCVVPDFKAYINPIQMRRLSRMLRIGLSAATICLRDAGIKTPDGIITATGYGFLEETAKFLNEVLEQSERQLTPTYFMQSTSNAMAGVVALTFKCMGFNNTYASKGFAMENALLDGMMQLNDNKSGNLLVGSYDEAAAVQYKASVRARHFKVEHVNNLRLFDTNTKGSIQGEGAAFFMLSGTVSPSTWCKLRDIHFLYKPSSTELQHELQTFLKNNKKSIDDIDVVVNGASGDVDLDVVINDLIKKVAPESLEVRFKHLCGEYSTSTSFAMWVGAAVLKKQEIPMALRLQPDRDPQRLDTILVVNQYMAKTFTFVLMTRY